MEYIGTIVFVIIVIAGIVSWFKNLSPADKSRLQGKLAEVLGGQNDSGNSGEVKIYDENGNVINFQNNTVENSNAQDVVIYDENGIVMSAQPVPASVTSTTESMLAREAEQEVRQSDVHENANMYQEFIRSNGDSAIVIQEIIGKPIALRD